MSVQQPAELPPVDVELHPEVLRAEVDAVLGDHLVEGVEGPVLRDGEVVGGPLLVPGLEHLKLAGPVAAPGGDEGVGDLLVGEGVVRPLVPLLEQQVPHTTKHLLMRIVCGVNV